MIEINPNIRVNHNHTYTYIDDITGLREGDTTVVYQPQMNMSWPATIVEVGADGYLELDVSWAKWKTTEGGN